MSKTIPENLEALLKNSEKYDINIYAILDLRTRLFTMYANTQNTHKEKQMIDWFEQKDNGKEFKLWKMSKHQKYCYARYLGLIGEYNGRSLSNAEIAIFYLTKALKILDGLEGYTFLKFNLYSHLARYQASLGNVQTAKEILKKMEELFEQGLQEDDVSMIYSLKARLLLIQGKYNDALDYIDKSIEVRIKSGLNINDIYLTSPYIVKVTILNSLGKYQEAYVQAKQLYDMHKPVKGEDHEIFGSIYTQMAISELGLGRINKALDYINRAIAIAFEHKNFKYVDYFAEPDLAPRYIVLGNILFAQDNIKEAIESYKKAYAIYHYLYKDRSKNVAQISDLYSRS